MYYWCCIALSEISNREASPEMTPASLMPSAATGGRVAARSASLFLIREMLPIFRQWRQMYGGLRAMAESCQTAAVACFILLKALSNPASRTEANEEALMDLTVYLMMGGRRWLVYAGMLRMLRPTAQSLGVELPQRLTEMLDEFDKTVWTVEGHKRIRSVYPNLAFVKKDALDDEQITMGQLLAKWESFSTDDADENEETKMTT